MLRRLIERFFLRSRGVAVPALYHFDDAVFVDRENVNGVFGKIYRDNLWGNGSGGGSHPRVNRDYVSFLEELFKRYAIKSVVDLGCGDWQFSKRIDWTGIEYTGIDVVESVVVENQERYSRPNVSFRFVNVLESGFAEVPDADLFVTKDVLQHLSNSNVRTILQGALSGKFKYLLITNDFLEGDVLDIPNGDTRPLDIRRSPLNVAAAVPVLAFNGKQTFFVDCGAATTGNRHT